MVLYKIIAIGIISCILVVQLKQTRPEIAFLCLIAAGIIILSMLMDYFSEVVSVFGRLTEKTGINGDLFTLILKMIGIGYITEIAANTVEDFGSKSIADKIVLGGKLTILVMALPIITSLINLITEMI